MAEENGYKIQINPTIKGILFNVRANSVAELEETLAALAKGADGMVSSLNDFQQVVVAKATFAEGRTSGGGGAAKASGPKVNADGIPVCEHGPMKDLRGAGYKADFYCSAPKGTKQCQSVKL